MDAPSPSTILDIGHAHERSGPVTIYGASIPIHRRLPPADTWPPPKRLRLIDRSSGDTPTIPLVANQIKDDSKLIHPLHPLVIGILAFNEPSVYKQVSYATTRIYTYQHTHPHIHTYIQTYTYARLHT
jgi:hypothetical protein